MDLEPVEQRILGSLLEKQVTVPASYPLTLSSLRTACNQTSSREPVMELDERTVELTARALKDRGLLRVVWTDTGRRTLKYHQTLSEILDLADDERAVLTVLLLRGPQSPGELRTRTERLYPFADRAAVEACLERMARRDSPLVQRLERRPGQQDYRWVHELGPVETGETPPRPAVDREAPIADSCEARDDRVRATYGVVGIRLDPEDRVVDMIIVEPSVTILTACEKGYGKRSAVDAYRLQSRAGKGIINIKATERNGKVVGMKAVRDEDDLIMITSGGQVVRIAVKEVRVMGRNTQGVRLISLDEKDSLVSIARVEKDQDDGGVKRVEVPKDEPTEPETPDEPEPTPSN